MKRAVLYLQFNRIYWPQTKTKESIYCNTLGKSVVKRIYTHSDVLHCEVKDSVAEEFINMCSIKTGDFDNVAKCKYEVPDYWTIGEVYERLIEDVQPNENVDSIIEPLFKVYNSWVSDSLLLSKPRLYKGMFFKQQTDCLNVCIFYSLLSMLFH